MPARPVVGGGIHHAVVRQRRHRLAFIDIPNSRRPIHRRRQHVPATRIEGRRRHRAVVLRCEPPGLARTVQVPQKDTAVYGADYDAIPARRKCCGVETFVRTRVPDPGRAVARACRQACSVRATADLGDEFTSVERNDRLISPNTTVLIPKQQLTGAQKSYSPHLRYRTELYCQHLAVLSISIGCGFCVLPPFRL